MHWPLIDFECGPTGGADDFLEWFFKADRGELEPFVLVVEGSIPNEKLHDEGYWCGFGNDPATGQPMTTSEWLDRLAPKATAVVAVGTCATYGGIHAMAGNPTGAMGVPDYLGWDWKSKAGIPIVCVPGLPDPAGQPVRDAHLPALHGHRPGADDPARRRAAPDLAVRRRPCTRAATAPATTSRATSPPSTARPKCIVKLGCWGPVVKCNVPKRGWINGIGGCPNVGGICIGCTMPGFPDKFMPFMDEPPGGKLSTDARPACTAPTIRRLRSVTTQHPRQGAQVAQAGQASSPPAPPAPGRPPTSDPRSDQKGGDAMTSTIPAAQHLRTQDARRPRRDGVGPDHPDRRQPRHLHQDRLRTRRSSPSATAPSSIFRGYSIFMKGKDPRDAHFITSRICGICGDNHATCSCYAQNMAYGVKPPHLGEWIVNLGEAAEYMFDHNIFQENLVGVDYCEKMVAETNPGVLEPAEPHRGAARRTPTATGPSATSCGR